MRDGKTPSLIPLYNEIHHNFFICNYGSNLCIDNDDGSSYYQIHHNFEVYGGHKSDFGGHNKFTFQSINAYAKVYTDGICASFGNTWAPGYVDGYYLNKCVQNPVQPYQQITGCDYKKIDPTVMPVSYGNSIYSPGNEGIQCGSTVVSEAQWQSMGWDHETVYYPLPTDAVIIGWAKEMLGL